jgi:hypothetical protein
MKPLDRRIAAKSGLRSVPAKRIAAKLMGDPAHINPKEDRLLRQLMPESHGRVLVSGLLAELGRRGDDRVTLVNSREAKLLKRRGGSGARNPASGLREYEDDSGTGNPGGGHNGDTGPGSSGMGGPGSSTSTGSSTSSSPGGGTSVGGGTDVGPARDVGYSWGNSPTGYRSPDPDQPDGRGFHPENNPEMGGGVARGRGLASVAALGPTGRSTHAASSVMAGEDPTFGDRVSDFIGLDAPMGIPGSRAANVVAALAGGFIGGALGGPVGAPIGAALASVAHNATIGGRSLADTVPGAIGGYFGGGLGSMAAQAAVDAIRGKETYDAPMTENDRARRNSELDAEARGERPSRSEPGSNDGAGAGVDYLKEPASVAPTAPAPIPAASNAPLPASAARDGWDEQGFLTRNPEVARAVQDGIWTSGRSFNAAYKTQAGANYDSAKALGLISPYTNDLLTTRSGQALPYRG